MFPHLLGLQIGRRLGRSAGSALGEGVVGVGVLVAADRTSVAPGSGPVAVGIAVTRALVVAWSAVAAAGTVTVAVEGRRRRAVARSLCRVAVSVGVLRCLRRLIYVTGWRRFFLWDGIDVE